MTDLVRFLVLGLGPGAAYALAALGIVLVYRGSGVLNFAHGAFAFFAAAWFVEFRESLGVWGAAGTAIVVTSLLGASVQVLVMSRLAAASPLARLIATLGVMTVVLEGSRRAFGDELVSVPRFLPEGTVDLAGATVAVDRFILVGITLAIAAVLWAVYRKSTFGLLTTAVAENEIATAALGHSPGLVATVNWALGAALAAAAGVLIVPLTSLSSVQLTLLVLPALAAALLGGFSSFPITVVGGLLVGIAESELTHYVHTPGWSSSVPFVVIVAVLLFRGRALPVRGHVAERLPLVGSGTIRPIPVTIAVGVAIASVFAFSDNWAAAMTTTAAIGLVCLSLVVVTGLCGQLSLGQLALAGFGAWAAARVAEAHGTPFLVSLLIGALSTVPVGVVLGLPALRARGVNLAVATLSLSLVVEHVLLGNADYTGGLSGTIVPKPEVFGWSIDPAAHPARYAAATLLVFLVAALAVANVRRGRSGLRMIAVRGNERAAASLGISVTGAKLSAFALSAAIAGAGGVVLAFRSTAVVFTQFDAFGSINVVVQAVVGGIGYVLGAVVGAANAPGGAVPQLIDSLVDIQDHVVLLGGLVLLVVLVQDANGIAHQLTRHVQIVRQRLGRAPRRTSVPALPLAAAEAPRAPGRTLEVRDVTIRFGGVVALDQVSVTVRPGEVVGLIGANGAGKTTLIDGITGFASVASGDVLIDGSSLRSASPTARARRGIARSFQSLELFEDLSVLDNLRCASESQGGLQYLVDVVWPGHRPLRPALVEAIHELGLVDVLHLMPEDLPHGTRRLVGIARALATEPSILLLDEPAAGLDEDESAELGRLIRRMADRWGIGILLIEHDVALVMETSDRIHVLDFGHTIAEGAPSAIRNDARVVEAYLGVDRGDASHPSSDAPLLTTEVLQ